MILFDQQANEIQVYHKDKEVGVIDYLADRGWFFIPNGHTLTSEIMTEIVFFLDQGEKNWLKIEIAEMVNYPEWWDKPNETFGGKTPNEQLEEDTTPIWVMYIMLAHGVIT